MSAGDTIEALLKLGVALKDAFTKAKSNKTATDWLSFLDSDAFKAVAKDVEILVGKLKKDDLDNALKVTRDKQAALVAAAGGVAQLPTDKLLQYADLVHTESLLVNRKVDTITTSAEALAWVVDDALPILLSVAKVVLPLLL